MKEHPVHPLQAMVDGLGAAMQRERSGTQLTLGGLIAVLEELPPERTVEGIGEPHSYRGYYCDLAFEPNGRCTVRELLATARSCMGKVFVGYKGGDFMMGESTPLWISTYGDSSGDRLMALNSATSAISPVTLPDND